MGRSKTWPVTGRVPVRQEATDGIAPILSVSVDGSADTVTNDTLTVLVSADEKSRNPTRTNGITVSAIEKKGGTDDDADTDVVGKAAGFSAAKFRTVTSGEQWEWTFSLANTTNGTYNVCIAVFDISGDDGNEGTKGTCTAGDPIDADKSITFTVDTVVNDPAVTPEKTDNAGTFIEIGYGEKITALTATIGGEQVDTATLDDKTFTIAPPADGYEIGEHEVAVTATDVAGNTKTAQEDGRSHGAGRVHDQPEARLQPDLAPGHAREHGHQRRDRRGSRDQPGADILTVHRGRLAVGRARGRRGLRWYPDDD